MTTVNVNEDKYSVTVTEGATTVVTVKAPGPQGPGFPDGNLGDVTSSNTGASVVVNSGAITNAKVNDSAAIAGTKISPDFGSQNITTTGNAVFGGNLTVSGSVTTIDTTTLRVEDKNIELGKVGSPTDITADGGGITLLGDTNHTFNWVNATDSWTSSENLSLPDNKRLRLGGSTGDLQLYHGGTNSIINNFTGDLKIQLSGTDTIKLYQSDKSVGLFFNGSQKVVTSTNGLDFPDNSKLQLGDSADLKIFHDGSHSIIAENGTGNLLLCGTRVNLFNSARNETLISAQENGPVQLFYDNVKKAETTATGFNINGTCVTLGATHFGDVTFTGDSANIVFDKSDSALEFADNAELRLGSADEVRLFHNGSSTSFIVSQHFFNLQANGYFFYNQAGNETLFSLEQNGAVKLYYDNVNKFETTSIGATVNGHLLASTDGNTTISLLDTGHGFPQSEIKLSNGGRDLNITAPKDIRLFPQSGENGIVLEANGQVELYYDNVKKLETTSTGIDVVGTVTCDDILLANAILHEGQTNTKIEFDTTVIKFDSNGVTRFQIHPAALFVQEGYKLAFIATSGENPYIRSFGTNNGDLQIGQGTESMAQFKRNAAVELYHNGTKKLETTSSGITVQGSVTTEDMNMSNLNGTANEVDNTKGSWSIQEGADDLFIINRVSGKKYKFNLTEIS